MVELKECKLALSEPKTIENSSGIKLDFYHVHNKDNPDDPLLAFSVKAEDKVTPLFVFRSLLAGQRGVASDAAFEFRH